jgi:hypothetical protein
MGLARSKRKRREKGRCNKWIKKIMIWVKDGHKAMTAQKRPNLHMPRVVINM